MKPLRELESLLQRIDGRGYKAYKDIGGQYRGEKFSLFIDYVQGDPFASPSRIRVAVPGEAAGFPRELYDSPCKKRAVVDFLSRTFAGNISRLYGGGGGTGKSGLLAIGSCGQEILERNFILIDDHQVEARLELGLPAAGRRILGREAGKIFFEALPKIVEASLFFKALDGEKLIRQVQLAEDQYSLRREIKKRGLVAFVANGSILPRESGVSQRPMARGAVPFQSPKELEIEIHLPHRGPIKGMGVPEGVTLIVGGGFHGKSTLLQALERGVYDHVAGDGREYVVCRESAVKIKAENGRRVEKVDISPFINNLPLKQDTVRFSTENASGSTSQAANIMEALEVGTEVLLIDEDTSATNFMIRDGRMQELVEKEKEPITPFIDRVRDLCRERGVSTILVIGGSGDYFAVADRVIRMDAYVPADVTLKAREINGRVESPRKVESPFPLKESPPRILLPSSFPSSSRGVKIKPRGRETITYDRTDIDLRDLEQLVDYNQTNALSFILWYIKERWVDGQKTLPEVVEGVYREILTGGLDVVSPFKGHPGNMALPRPQEIAATLNRYRGVRLE